ncbi:hypothetical protein HDZ31DRAFT_50532, partial [Schizophyllum fasciatum]
MNPPAAPTGVLYSSPEKGTICVMQIDPVKTLASVGDVELTESARSLHTGKYLVCITGVHNSFASQERPDSYTVAFISHKIHDRFSNVGIPDTCAVAISPNRERVQGRRPLRLSRPLPFPEAYMSIPIGETATVRIETAFTAKRPQYKLPPNELTRWSELDVQLDVVEEDDEDEESLEEFGVMPKAQTKPASKPLPPLPCLSSKASKASSKLKCLFKKEKSLPKLPELEPDEVRLVSRQIVEDDSAKYYDPFGLLTPPPTPAQPANADADSVTTEDTSSTADSYDSDSSGVTAESDKNATYAPIHNYPESLLENVSFSSDVARADAASESHLRYWDAVDIDICAAARRTQAQRDSVGVTPDPTEQLDAERERTKPTQHLPLVTLDFDVDGAVARGELLDLRRFRGECRTLEFMKRERRRQVAWSI